MFTGIVEQVGRVVSMDSSAAGATLCVDAGVVSEGTPPGASVAVQGVCLTVSRVEGRHLRFDVVHETLDRSTLGRLRPGGMVNLERAVAVGGRLDGHFVQGHVDGQARLRRRETSGGEARWWFTPHAELRPFLVPKGSVAVDGVSLTIAELAADDFSVALVPTTLERTTLGALSVGEAVNLETDILVRAVVHALGAWKGTEGVTLAKLREHGFQ